LEFSNKYIIIFSLVLCLVCSLAVSTAAVVLKPLQEANKLHDLQLNILHVSGLLKDGETCTPEQATELFQDITAWKVSRTTGEKLEKIEFGSVDMFKESKDSATSAPSTSGAAKDAAISRYPNDLVVLEVTTPGQECYVLQFWGNGLWSTMHGYIAMQPDLEHIKGLTFVEHGETPGLGGEVDNPNWKKQWPSRQLHDASGALGINVMKSGKVKDATVQVDGISGATITSHAVGSMMQAWFGDEGYGPFLAREKEAKS